MHSVIFCKSWIVTFMAYDVKSSSRFVPPKTFFKTCQLFSHIYAEMTRRKIYLCWSSRHVCERWVVAKVYEHPLSSIHVKEARLIVGITWGSIPYISHVRTFSDSGSSPRLQWGTAWSWHVYITCWCTPRRPGGIVVVFRHVTDIKK